MKKKEKLGVFSGAALLTLAAILTKILGLVYKMPLSRLLGDEGMGYFNTAYTVYAFFFLLCSTGVPKAVAILVGDAEGKGSLSSARRVYSVCLRVFSAVGGALFLTFAVFSAPLARFLKTDGAVLPMLAIAPAVFFSSVAGVARGYLSGESDFFPIALSEIVEGGVKFVFGLLFAFLGTRLSFSLPLIAAFSILGVCLGSFAGMTVLYIRSKIKLQSEKIEQNMCFQESSRLILSRFFRVALPITLTAAVSGLGNLLDLSLLLRRLSAVGISEREAAALYGNYSTLAIPMFNLVASLLAPVSVCILPLLSRQYVQKSGEHLETAREAMRVVSMLSSPAAFGYLFFSREILALLFAKGSAAVGAPLLSLLAPGVLFASLLTVANTVLEATGSVKIPILSTAIGLLIKLSLTYILVGIPEIGIAGAPIGSVVSYAVSLVVSLAFLAKQGVHFRFFETFALPMTAAFLSASFSAYFSRAAALSGVTGTILLLLLYGMIFLIFSMLFGLLSTKEVEKVSKLTNIS